MKINQLQKINDNEIEAETADQEMIDFYYCNCKEDGKNIATHFCEDCVQGFCLICIKAHQRFKLTRLHKLHLIKHFCECKSEDKRIATKYCQECSEVFCAACVIAHRRLIITRNHTLIEISKEVLHWQCFRKFYFK